MTTRWKMIGFTRLEDLFKPHIRHLMIENGLSYDEAVHWLKGMLMDCGVKLCDT